MLFIKKLLFCILGGLIFGSFPSFIYYGFICRHNKYSTGDCYTQDVEAWEDHTICRIKIVGKKKYKVACPLAPGLFVEDEVETTETFQTIEENTIKVPCGVTQ